MDTVELITNLGLEYILYPLNVLGLGVVALLLLKSVIHQQKELTTALINHMHDDAQRLELLAKQLQGTAQILESIQKGFEKHWEDWGRHDRESWRP